MFTTGYGQNKIKQLNFGKNIKVNVNTLLQTIILSPDIFDRKYNRLADYYSKNNLIREGEVYDPPFGWYGFALKVLDKYDNGDNSWLGKNGKKGEWAVGYHGVGKGNIIIKVIKIINEGLKEGKGQVNADFKDIRRGGLCGNGVYLTPKIEYVKKYADIVYASNLGMKFIIMCRVNPPFIREPRGMPDEWVLNENFDEVRPYRILVQTY